MLIWIQQLFFIMFIATCASVIYHTISYRRAKDPVKRGILQARNNISMGVMLILFAVAQNFYFTDSTFRRIFATICLLIGVFNLFAGIRNYISWKRNSL
jgi:hypothetical protein